MDHRRFQRTRAAARQQSLRGRCANLPVAAFRNHDQQMKNWKGLSPPPLTHSHRAWARSP
jgi:hypothetical protein